jgi:hypothetical protein
MLRPILSPIAKTNVNKAIHTQIGILHLYYTGRICVYCPDWDLIHNVKGTLVSVLIKVIVRTINLYDPSDHSSLEELNPVSWLKLRLLHNLMVGVAGFEPAVSWSQTRRFEPD